jgi:hypothetical protein
MPILGTVASSTRQGLSTNSFFSLATANPSGTSSVTFNSSGVWADYTHLYVSFIAKQDVARPNATIICYVNGDQTSPSYIGEQVEWDGRNNSTTSQLSNTYTPNTSMAGNTLGANFYSSGFLNFYDINATNKFKAIRADGAFVQNGTASGQNNATITFSTYKSTTAITSITFTTDNGSNFMTNTNIALYGIKG